MHTPSNRLGFSTNEAYHSHLTDIDFWLPTLTSIINENQFATGLSNITAGFNSTYPVFLIDNIVIKLFGHRANWQETFVNECSAHQILAQDTRICAPQILASGQLPQNKSAPWAYTVSNLVPGHSWLNSDLSPEQQATIVSELGEQLKYIHALPISQSLKPAQDWRTLDIQAAATQSSLPQHLLSQVNDFMANLAPFDSVFVNGDIVSMHVFVDNGHLSGIIDWGDATVTDRHYDIGKLALSHFPGNKALLTTLLDAANWPMQDNFATQSLGLALYRQAVGLTQHRCFDIFYQLSSTLPIDNMQSLDELAELLFDVTA
jgi:hygromycin-B 7''-O-kinase